MTSPYGVVVYDDLGNRVYYAGGGTSGGSLKVKPAPHVTRTYTAFVALTWPSTAPATGVQASSAVSVTNVGYTGTLDLHAPATIVKAVNPSQTLVLSTSPVITSPYWVSVYDDTNHRIYYSCLCGVTYGSLNVTTAVNTTRTWTAYVAQDYPVNGPPQVDVQGVSSTTVTNVGYTGNVTLTADVHQLDAGHGSAHFTVTTSEPTGSPYQVSIYDNLGQRIYYRNGYNSGGSTTVSLPANTTRTYTAYVAQDVPSPGPPRVDVVASSAPWYLTSIPAGDNVDGVSVSVMTGLITTRYAMAVDQVCVAAGEMVPTSANGSSEPDVTLACEVGGLAGMVDWLKTAVGAARTAQVLWQLVYGGAPATIEGVPVPTADPTPLPRDTTRDEPVISGLANLIYTNSQQQAGPSDYRRMNPAQARLVATQCLEQSRLGGASASDCGAETIFIPGEDSGDAGRNDDEAIRDGRPWRLHFVRGVNQLEWDEGWYRANNYYWGRTLAPGCNPDEPHAGQSCDEYPFRSSNEAGPPGAFNNPAGARLAWVPMGQNSSEGSMYQKMSDACGLEPDPVLRTPVLGDDRPGKESARCLHRSRRSSGAVPLTWLPKGSRSPRSRRTWGSPSRVCAGGWTGTTSTPAARKA